MRNNRWVSSLPQSRHAGLLLFVFLLSCGSIFGQSDAALNVYFQRARDRENAHDYAGAERVYQEASGKFPHQPELLKRLGIVYQTELKLPESVSTFEQVLQMDPQYPEVNFYLGVSYFGLNDLDKAIASFEKELEFNPRYRRARFFEAQADRVLGHNADAFRQYEILVKQNPKDQRALFELVRFLRSETLAALNDLGSVDPDSEYVLVLKAEGYAEEQKYTEAIADYQQALQKNPAFLGLHFALGEIYYAKADYPASERELRLALQEDPNYPKANYYLADILLKSGRMTEAVPHLELVLDGDPGFVKGYVLLGKCRMEQGRSEEAATILEKAAVLDPKDKNVHYQLAQIYQKLKQPDKAHEHLQIFQALYAQERDEKAKRDHELQEHSERSKE